MGIKYMPLSSSSSRVCQGRWFLVSIFANKEKKLISSYPIKYSALTQETALLTCLPNCMNLFTLTYRDVIADCITSWCMSLCRNFQSGRNFGGYSSTCLYRCTTAHVPVVYTLLLCTQVLIIMSV